MGTLLDTSVLIELERADRVGGAMPVAGARLAEQLGADGEVAIAAITAAELLHGVHRASEAYRARREAFVEAVLAAMPTLAYDLLVARVHARLWAMLAATGSDVGAHDRIVAATAISAGWQLATANARHFSPIPGLLVTSISLA